MSSRYYRPRAMMERVEARYGDYGSMRRELGRMGSSHEAVEEESQVGLSLSVLSG